MTVRLYDSAWVYISDNNQPFRVNKDARNAAIFEVASFLYDIDGRPLSNNPTAPQIIAVLSLQEIRDAGIVTDYNRDLRTDVGKAFNR